VLDALAQSGCQRLLFGIESGDDSVLRRLGKKHTSADAVRVVRDCAERGIVPVPSVIIGLPDATRESDVRTLDLCERVVAESGCRELVIEEFLPVPDTPYVDGGRVAVEDFVREAPSEDAMAIAPHVYFRPSLVPWRIEAYQRALRLARRVDFFPVGGCGA
jgi:radical SAM superfamily enzyme YgiQ (UPF0313 family)